MQNKEKQILTVGQLKNILNSQVNDSNKDNPVVITANPISDKGMIGVTPHVTCYPVAFFGFDWDTGLFFINPNEPLFYKD